MADTSIEWTQKVWNPIVGCSIHSPGCKNCYAMRMAWRLQGMAAAGNASLAHYAGTVEQSKAGPVWTGKLSVAPDDVMTAPLRRKVPTTYFVNRMSDLFHTNVPDEVIDRVFAVMALTPQHTYQVLTKRADRMRAYGSDPKAKHRIAATIIGMMNSKLTAYSVGFAALQNRRRDEDPETIMWPLPNVWLGVSVEDQKRADERVPDLLATPAAIRWLSCEPLLGPVFLRNFDLDFRPGFTGFYSVDALTGGNEDMCRPCPSVPKLDWIVAGGESGPGARGSTDEVEANMRFLLAQCRATSVPFFGKQNFRKLPLPDDLMVREMPKVGHAGRV